MTELHQWPEQLEPVTEPFQTSTKHKASEADTEAIETRGGTSLQGSLADACPVGYELNCGLRAEEEFRTQHCLLISKHRYDRYDTLHMSVTS